MHYHNPYDQFPGMTSPTGQTVSPYSVLPTGQTGRIGYGAPYSPYRVPPAMPQAAYYPYQQPFYGGAGGSYRIPPAMMGDPFTLGGQRGSSYASSEYMATPKEWQRAMVDPEADPRFGVHQKGFMIDPKPFKMKAKAEKKKQKLARKGGKK